MSMNLKYWKRCVKGLKEHWELAEYFLDEININSATAFLRFQKLSRLEINAIFFKFGLFSRGVNFVIYAISWLANANCQLAWKFSMRSSY